MIGTWVADTIILSYLRRRHHYIFLLKTFFSLNFMFLFLFYFTRLAFFTWRENSKGQIAEKRHEQAAGVHFNRQLLSKVRTAVACSNLFTTIFFEYFCADRIMMLLFLNDCEVVSVLLLIFFCCWLAVIYTE
jgi:hypothetical protein